MALVACRECNNFIYEFAETCPNCGSKNPGITHEELRKKDEYERAKREEKEYERIYMSLGFIDRLTGKHDKYVKLAEEANVRVLELLKELHELERNKERR